MVNHQKARLVWRFQCQHAISLLGLYLSLTIGQKLKALLASHHIENSQLLIGLYMLHVERSLFLLGEPLHTHLLRTDSQRQPQQPYYRQPPFHFPVTDILPLAFVTEI